MRPQMQFQMMKIFLWKNRQMRHCLMKYLMMQHLHLVTLLKMLQYPTGSNHIQENHHTSLTSLITLIHSQKHTHLGTVYLGEI